MGSGPRVQVFDVAQYGAVGDGNSLDSPAIQRAIDAAAAYVGKAQVLVRGGKKYVIGTLELRSSIDFHLADDAQLLASTRREDYRGGLAGATGGHAMATATGGLIVADGATGLTISGTGSVQGRAREFMQRYDDAGEWWIPKAFRPKMFLLTGCRDLEVRPGSCVRRYALPRDPEDAALQLRPAIRGSRGQAVSRVSRSQDGRRASTDTSPSIVQHSNTYAEWRLSGAAKYCRDVDTTSKVAGICVQISPGYFFACLKNIV